MTDVPSYFTDLLDAIRLQERHVKDLKIGHTTLRSRLNEYTDLAPLIVTTFLQGSYRRSTAIRPHGDTRADADVVVVTRLSQAQYTPHGALMVFKPFLDKYYTGKYKFQGRSIGIELSYVDLDLVITSAPSESDANVLKSASVTTDESLEEADDWLPVKSWISKAARVGVGNTWTLMERAKSEPAWQLSPLYIPDRESKKWERTHPLAQIKWTAEKNARCNKHYVNVVKALKWWRRVNHPTPKHPKGYPLEHIIGYCCPVGIGSVGEGVTRTLEAIARDPSFVICVAARTTPFLSDHGVPEHNVLARVPAEDFAAFWKQAKDAATIARVALDADTVAKSVEGWKVLFGKEFPDAPPNGSNGGLGKGGYSAREEKSVIPSTGRRFA